MNIYCPLVRENCKGNECVMWKEEKCLIASALETYISVEHESYTPSAGISVGFSRPEEEVPEEITTATSEQLAAEMIDYTMKNFVGEMENQYMARQYFRMYLEGKNVQEYMLPAEIRLKVQRAYLLAEKQIADEIMLKKAEIMQKEKTELPSLVSQCIDWAQNRSLKRITLADVDAFLI
ncbi:MAG: hypothetical protein PHQ86_08015 [Dehalococcoidales bacterium]|nr:hypothetical protein [Dehalococcoidales bacterium]